MKMSAPKRVTWWISLILVVLGVIAYFVSSLGLASFAFWLVLVGAAILLIANITKGL